jgi:tetratricopeptide (TPR) repeat protein
MQSAEVEETYRRADQISVALRDDIATYKSKWGLWINTNLGRKTALARTRASELLEIAQRSGDGDLLLEAHHCRWSTGFFSGEVATTLEDCRIGVETYDMARHRHLGHAFGGHDPGACAHVERGIVLQVSGARERFKDGIASAIALAERLDHPNSLGHVLLNSGIASQLIADRDSTLAVAQRAFALAGKFGLTPWRASSLLLTAWVTAVGSGVAASARLFDAEIDKATASGPVAQYYLGLAGEVLLAAGRPANGLAYLDRAVAAIDEPGVGFYLPEIYRLRGQCLLALRRDAQDEAGSAFAMARDIARRQGAAIFEARAHESLSELARG